MSTKPKSWNLGNWGAGASPVDAASTITACPCEKRDKNAMIKLELSRRPQRGGRAICRLISKDIDYY